MRMSTTNPPPDLAAQFMKAQRKESAQFQCHKCSQTFHSEGSWWKHLGDSHKEELADLASEEDLLKYRNVKKEECRIIKNRSKPGPSNADKGQDSAGTTPVHTRASRQARSGELTKGIETLRLERAHADEARAKDEDVPMGEASVSPTNELSRSRQEPNKRSRTNQKTSGARAGRRTKNQPLVDPDFIRATPDSPEASRPRKLYDPNGPATPSKAVEDTTKRLDNPSASTRTPSQSVLVTNPRNISSTPKRKERRKTNPRGGRSESGNVGSSSQKPQDGQGLGREAGKTFIIKRSLEQTQGQVAQRMDVEDGPVPEDDPSVFMVRQPETRPISADQLLSEVKGIYAGLVMVEAKCVEVDGKQAAQAKAMEAEGLEPHPLTNEQWQALIALHRTLLHEHHDFFLASQHPSSSPALRRLAAKYAMPARMWRHGIHSFLELLRHRLPHSLEHMLTFIYLAYSIMALLYETVPAFEETWIECLGDLGRYRMAIEDDDIRDREVWTVVARTWYSKAADQKPTVGRLYHHIAILARPNVLQQLFYYCKSLTVTSPFAAARESILSLFDPVLANKAISNRPQSVDVTLVTLHAIWFTHIGLDRFDDLLDQYLTQLKAHIISVRDKWSVQGCFIAVCNIAALYQYNSRSSKLRQAWREGRITIKEEVTDDAPTIETTAEKGSGTEYDSLLPPLPRGASSEHVTALAINTKPDSTNQGYKAKVAAIIREEAANEASWVPLEYAIKMGFKILALVLRIQDDKSILPHIHAWLVFLYHIKDSIPAMRLLETDFPWEDLAEFLNSLTKSEDGALGSTPINFERDEFPRGTGRPLPEDWTLRGLEWVQKYFPEGWIERAKVDDEERVLELPSFHTPRKERILWLAYKVAKAGDWLLYDSKSETFSVHPALAERICSNKQAAILKQEQEYMPYIKKEEESDAEMGFDPAIEDNDGDFEDLGGSEEVQQLRALKMQQRELQSQLKSEKPSALDAEDMSLDAIRRVSARDALRPQYTVLVVDTNFLLSSLDIFRLMMANDEWTVVIPNSVMTELMGLNNIHSNVAVQAREAIAAIQEAITARKDLKIITAKGNDITRFSFYKEKLEEYKEDDKKIDDIIIEIADQQGKLRAEFMLANGTDPGSAQPAVLITDDRNMRVKATAKRVPAIASSALKEILAPKASIMASRSKRKSTTTPSSTAPKQIFSPTTEEPLTESTSDVLSVNAGQSSEKVASNKKRPKRETMRTAG